MTEIERRLNKFKIHSEEFVRGRKGKSVIVIKNDIVIVIVMMNAIHNDTVCLNIQLKSSLVP
jgi:hypothetical protein